MAAAGRGQDAAHGAAQADAVTDASAKAVGGEGAAGVAAAAADANAAEGDCAHGGADGGLHVDVGEVRPAGVGDYDDDADDGATVADDGAHSGATTVRGSWPPRGPTI